MVSGGRSSVAGAMRRCVGRSAKAMLGVTMMMTAPSAIAQSPAPLPQPNVQFLAPGLVNAAVRQADGGVVFGGRFTSINGAPRTQLARLLPDGTLDPAFAPVLASATNIDALALDASGNIFVAGSFSQINGVARSSLAKLSPAGVVDPTWNPNPDGQVTTLALGGSGELYFSGFFTTVGGTTRNRLAKVSATGAGTLDATWQATPNATASEIEVAADGSVFIAGLFNNVGGTPRAGLAKLAPVTGALDASWNPAPSNSVNELLLHAGSLYVGGLFETIGGVSRQRLAKLSPSGTGPVDPTWNPGASAAVGSMTLDANGQLLVSGSFNTIGGQSRRALARLSPNGTGAVDLSFDTTIDGITAAVVPLPDGRIVIGGQITASNGNLRVGLAQLSSTGTTLASAIDTELPGSVLALTGGADGAIIVGGSFHRVDGQARANLARFRSDGTLDPDWSPDANSAVAALALDNSGAVIAGGAFSRVDGVSRSALVRLTGTSGSVDPSWNPTAFGGISTLAVDAASNTLYAGGAFNSIGGQGIARLAKLSAGGSGTIDTAWVPAPDNRVDALALSGDGQLFVGGVFTSIGGQSRNRIARLSASGTGAADPAWNPSSSGAVTAIARRANGDVYVGGTFTSIGGASRLNLARLAGTGAGAADAGWSADAFGQVSALATDQGDVLYVAGGFGTIGSQTRIALGKVNGNGVVDAAWHPGASGNPAALHVDALGKVFVGGSMTTVGGQTRRALAALPSFHRASYAAATNGSLLGSLSQIVQHGGAGTAVTATPATGFRFALWSDGNTQNPRIDSGVVASLSVTASFTNDAPQIVSVSATPATIFEAESSLIAVNATDAEAGALAYAFDCNDDGAFEVGPQPANSANCVFPSSGARIVRVRVADGPGLAAFATVGVTVQDSRPVATLAPVATPLEDQPVALNASASSPSGGESVQLTEADCDFDGSTFDVDLSAVDPAALTCPGYPTGGARTIGLRARDNEGETGATATATVQVVAVNDAPLFLVGSDVFVAEDAPSQTITAWTTGFVPGPPDATDEGSQQVVFEVVDVTSTALFAVAPQVDTVGTLRFTPALDANGSAIVSIRACDDGASTPPDVACSAAQQFTINVAAINDAPSLQVDVVPPEPPASSGPRSVVGFAAFDAGPNDEDTTQGVDAYLVDAVLDPDGVLVAASVNVAANGTLGYVLSGNSGSASVALRVRDSGGTAGGGVNVSTTQLFSLRVGAGADLQVAKDNGVPYLVDGEATIYAVVVANAGPNAVTGAVLTDRLPPTLLSGVWACVQALSTATCPSPAAGEGDLVASVTLAVGEHLRFDVMAQVDATQGAFAVNIAEVALPEGVGVIDASNDRATDEDPIRPVAIFRGDFEVDALPRLTVPAAVRALRVR
jgi:uncharacterized delta-60 repeat protein